jgi:D-alanyl-D-alanine carboxypeptidase (penicillin-binding protein 5/6)
MLARIFVFLICLSVICAKPLKVEVSAPYAILMNADTGAILYAKNIHEKQHPASITKIATALYVLEKRGKELNALLEVSPGALRTIPAYLRQAVDSKHPSYVLEPEGTSMRVVPGERLPLASFLHGLMLCSGNDAANVLAENTSGSIDKFISELNQFLKSKGILETQFTNPHGLHHHEHWTTAYDMALMTKLALKNETFREIVRATKYDCPQSNKQPPRTLSQHNKLVKPGGPYFYPKAIGVKTGYVAKAGHTFVGAATHEGRTLIAVLLNCAESQHRFRDSIKLFETAFKEKLQTRVLFAKESDHFSLQVKGAKGPLDAVLKENLALEFYPAEEPAFQAEINWNLCKLPIKSQEMVGHLRLVASGKILKELPVYAAHDVDQKWWAVVADFCSSNKPLLLALFLGGQVAFLLVYLVRKNQKVS